MSVSVNVNDGAIELRVDEAFCEVYLFGAHVTRYWKKSGEPIIFLSKQAVLDGTKAIRGGIPICWPQFGPNGPLAQHGFARNSVWKLVGSKAEDRVASVTLSLSENAETLKLWPHAFQLQYTVILTADDLSCQWKVLNTSSSEPFKFTGALHSYFVVSDVKDIKISDLSGLTYKDNTGGPGGVETTNLLPIVGNVDRVYYDAPTPLHIHDGDSRVIIVKKDVGLPDAIVWNPHAEKAKGMADFGDDEWTSMVCVEPGVVGRPVELAGGQSWATVLIISEGRAKI